MPKLNPLHEHVRVVQHALELICCKHSRGRYFDIAGDRFVLCSDGVHGYLETPEQFLSLCAGRSRDDAARALITHALNGGRKDNATALVVDVVA